MRPSPAIAFPSRPDSNDGLDAIRGVITGTLLSLLAFWLPLTLLLTH
jgi:hypothetical protein